MATKYIEREVTFTTIKASKIVTENGSAKLVPVEDVTEVGNVSMEKAQKKLDKEYKDFPERFVVTEAKASTKRFKMPLETFLNEAEEVVKEEVVEEVK